MAGEHLPEGRAARRALSLSRNEGVSPLQLPALCDPAVDAVSMAAYGGCGADRRITQGEQTVVYAKLKFHD
ncbi:tyrosine-protein phosphatase non-receptor type 11-like [Platysternon megacephalum]|uniref:Tyrosine-protein phosphatase non-receptor type 11-like n=1 Tax=Platysternon megacephalum TaxID=55544 RepID=A0A4D9ERC7_9SAUR|nr:tyrosine-protein phosphatase non-receptor type 11-like [Platysternon megacephalum]